MSVNASLTVEISEAPTETITVDYATSDGTAKAGTDYVSSTGTINFSSSTTSNTITIPVTSPVKSTPDNLYFYVTLSNVSGEATILYSKCVVNIVASS